MEKQELLKNLESVIDETLAEIEDLKKSRMAAAEIKIEGPGDGIDGKPTNGSIGKAEDKDEKGEDDGDKDDEKKEDKSDKDDSDKKDDDDKKENPFAKMEDGVYKMEGGVMSKMEDEVEKSDKSEEGETLSKNEETDVNEELVKSFNDKVDGLEGKIAGILDLIESIADQPVETRGVPAGAQPLTKSEPVYEQLSKTEAAEKLFELKKSGEAVSTEDITRIEAGDATDLRNIIKKYNLK